MEQLVVRGETPAKYDYGCCGVQLVAADAVLVGVLPFFSWPPRILEGARRPDRSYRCEDAAQVSDLVVMWMRRAS